MKKIILVIVILSLLGAGSYFYLKSNSLNPKTLSKLKNKSSGGVFNSIQEVLTKSMSIKCVYKDEKGVETTTYIKNGAIRMITTNNNDREQPNNMIIKDKKMYLWNSDRKTGFVFEFKDTDNSPIPTLEEEKELESEKRPKLQQRESILAEIEKYKDFCKLERIPDSMFNIPTDVQFQDMDKVQEQMMEQIPQAPSDENQEEMQKYIEDMMKQQGIEE